MPDGQVLIPIHPIHRDRLQVCIFWIGGKIGPDLEPKGAKHRIDDVEADIPTYVERANG
jgi:hypothetical protein